MEPASRNYLHASPVVASRKIGLGLGQTARRFTDTTEQRQAIHEANHLGGPKRGSPYPLGVLLGLIGISFFLQFIQDFGMKETSADAFGEK